MFTFCLTCLLLLTSVLNASLPKQHIICQPQFHWARGECTQQGTGCFIKTEKGIVALTSAHFIDFTGPQLLAVDWLDLSTQNAIATSTHSFGFPGRAGAYNPIDLRSDYFLMVLSEPVDPECAVELDPCTRELHNEPVWLPYKNGHKCIEGKISEAYRTHLLIELACPLDLQSCSGTPILSQKTGKVLGILTAGETLQDKTILYLTPAWSIQAAIENATHCPCLRNVVSLIH